MSAITCLSTCTDDKIGGETIAWYVAAPFLQRRHWKPALPSLSNKKN